ncbi:beta-ketoacyl synthase N-terminal-like domain-containing protein [Streptomyces camelliae]|uniref:Beta-ketoacyl synthase N-terminal-like domain-containing protein n=1 Tax=Streptomyces camelliae TaxID=3004093 RepID=A0ABY7P6W4_9ACTN|nr:beta-ketoacyl synthase N-terminal-like domain-containing protein [Streptomyces sp. HUAS 2-6]WBO66271.1 beta-ketoacyl synthase N-terminal-like domain-containing protein [Streptomyces sp. HUAS 2-6]
MSAAAELQISDVSVLSAAGVGLDALRARLREPGAAPGGAPAEDITQYEGLPGQVAAVPDFTITDYVPRKGTKNLDRTTKLGLAAATLLKRSLDERAEIGEASWASTGIAMGTVVGSLRSSVDLDIDIIEGKGTDLVNPAVFPNTTMNCCASQIAIWHSFRGPNSTLANGTVSALSALAYAARLIRCGHAERMLVGGVEELSPHTAWGIRLKKEVQESVFIGEGAALVALEPAGADASPAVATVTACEVMFAPERTQAGRTAALRRAVDRARAAAEAAGTGIDLVLPGNVGTALQTAEESALDHVDAERVDVRAAVGECGGALGAMQLAAAVALGRPGTGVLITGVDESGAVAAAVLTIEEHA